MAELAGVLVTATRERVTVTDVRPDGLAIAYARAVDRRDAPALLGLFAADAEVRLPAGLGGRGVPATTLRPAELLAPLDRWTRTRHLVMQQTIDFGADGTTATGECYSEAHHVGSRDDAPFDLVLHLRYLDEFVQTDDRWLFATRTLVVDWSSEMPVRLWD
jgi:hypothetical protein